jgi:hypothetical protein
LKTSELEADFDTAAYSPPGTRELEMTASDWQDFAKFTSGYESSGDGDEDGFGGPGGGAAASDVASSAAQMRSLRAALEREEARDALKKEEDDQAQETDDESRHY